jgi:hypothetical protein
VTSIKSTEDISDVQAAYEFAHRGNSINADPFHLSFISAVNCDYEFTQQAKQIAKISSIDIPPINNFYLQSSFRYHCSRFKLLVHWHEASSLYIRCYSTTVLKICFITTKPRIPERQNVLQKIPESSVYS